MGGLVTMLLITTFSKYTYALNHIKNMLMKINIQGKHVRAFKILTMNITEYLRTENTKLHLTYREKNKVFTTINVF